MEEYVKNKKDLLDIESEIMKRIKLLPKSKADLPYREKRRLVIEEMNKKDHRPIKDVQIDLQNNTIIFIDIPKILEFRDNIIEKKILEINDDSLTYEQKLLKVLKELKTNGKTIIISTHIFEVVEKVADRVGIVINGKLEYEDSISRIKKEKSLEDVFFEVYYSKEGEHQ